MWLTWSVLLRACLTHLSKASQSWGIVPRPHSWGDTTRLRSQQLKPIEKWSTQSQHHKRRFNTKIWNLSEPPISEWLGPFSIVIQVAAWGLGRCHASLLPVTKGSTTLRNGSRGLYTPCHGAKSRANIAPCTSWHVCLVLFNIHVAVDTNSLNDERLKLWPHGKIQKF